MCWVLVTMRVRRGSCRLTVCAASSTIPIGGGSTAAFQRVQLAYSVLSDEERRRTYDAGEQEKQALLRREMAEVRRRRTRDGRRRIIRSARRLSIRTSFGRRSGERRRRGRRVGVAGDRGE